MEDAGNIKANITSESCSQLTVGFLLVESHSEQH